MKKREKDQLIRHQEIIHKFRKNLTKLNKHHKLWLIFSIISLLTIFLIFILWDFIVEKNSDLLTWGTISSGITLSIIWWYWTMHLVRRMLNYQHSMIDILSEITVDIKEIKIEVSDLKNH